MSILVVGPQDPNAPVITPSWPDWAAPPNPMTVGGGIAGVPVTAPVLVPGPVGPPVALTNPDDLPTNLTARRDTSGMAGGGRTINSAFLVKNIIGKAVMGFEWAQRICMTNKSAPKAGERAEHAALYIEVDQDGPATSFGQVIEMRVNGGPDGDPIATVGMELDMWITNHTQDNGNRIFFDAMVAPDNQVAHGDQEVGATALGRTSASKNGYYSFGFILHFIRNTGVEVKSWWKGGQFAFRALGDWEAIYDASGATTRSGSALRLAAGQHIDFEPTCCRRLRFAPWTPDGKGDRLQYVVNGTPVFEITSDGHVMRGGVQIL